MKIRRSAGSRMLILYMAEMLLISNGVSVGATSNHPVFDPGPRAVGTFTGDCAPPTKLTGATNCLDILQPSSVAPAPFADGAGQVINANAPGGPSGPLVGLWFQGLRVFETPATVVQRADSNGRPSTIRGLGPSFNGGSCFECHSQPTVGGSSSGRITIPQNTSIVTFQSQIDPIKFTITGFTQNPQMTIANDNGATNTIPCFFTPGCAGLSLGFVQFNLGPIVEARVINAVAASGNAAAVAAGSVAELFVFSGRADAPPGCAITQVDTGGQYQKNNVVFRIPTPTYGLGLVENTPEQTLMNNVSAATALAAAAGLGPITGLFNRSANDGTINRFGWKAQNKSLLQFAGEAANVELGVTNENFPNEKTSGSGSACIQNTAPEDQALAINPTPTDATGSSQSSVIENLAVFMRLNGAPAQCNWNSGTTATGQAACLPLDADALAGQQLFGSLSGGASTVGVGCVLCHTDTLTTGPSITGGLNNSTYHPYSDFALHHLGDFNADFVTQGQAGGDQFRTAPLWGVGQRLFFMHDGRAQDLLTAIVDHCPTGSSSTTASDGFPASEACAVTAQFGALSIAQKNQLLKFLRSL